MVDPWSNTCALLLVKKDFNSPDAIVLKGMPCLPKGAQIPLARDAHMMLYPIPCVANPSDAK